MIDIALILNSKFQFADTWLHNFLAPDLANETSGLYGIMLTGEIPSFLKNANRVYKAMIKEPLFLSLNSTRNVCGIKRVKNLIIS